MHNGHRVDTLCSTLKTTGIMSLRGNDEKYEGMKFNYLNCSMYQHRLDICLELFITTSSRRLAHPDTPLGLAIGQWTDADMTLE